MDKNLIAVDLGGTRIRAAQLDRRLHILGRVEMPTRADSGPGQVIERVKAAIRQVLPENVAVAGIGVSSPGPVDPRQGAIIHPPNLPGWDFVPLGSALSGEFKLPVYVGHDVNAAVLAEAILGAARGYRHIIYLTISTGIGGGFIADDRLLLGRQGFTGEVGNIAIMVESVGTHRDAPSDDSFVGTHGCASAVSTLEQEASGTGLARRAIQLIQAGGQSHILEMAGGDLTAITGQLVGAAALDGDLLAREIVTRAGRLIGLGIVNLLHLFDPEIIVIGGGVTKLGDLLFDPLRETIQQHVMTEEYWRGLVITTPQLGEDVSIYGAAMLALTQGGVTKIADVIAQLGIVSP